MLRTSVLGLLLLLLAGAPAGIDAQTTQCDTCVPKALRLVGTPNWLAGSVRDTRCLVKETTTMRKEATTRATDAMKAVSAEGLDFMGRAWDLRTWTRASDGAVFYPYVFSKTLAHDAATGLPLARDVKAMLDAVQCPSAESIAQIPLHPLSARKLEGINNCQVTTLMGGEQLSFKMPDHYIHAVDSLEHAFEMAELYAMALLRDLPFVEFETSDKVRAVVAELNKFPFKTTAPTVGGLITPKTLLRGGQPGVTVGPCISQFFFNTFCARPRDARTAARESGCSSVCWF
jgi:hypothetical protein